MKKTELAKRYLIFLMGLVFNSFGVAFVTRAELGTSPIAAIPYSLSMILPALSMGNWVIIYNVLLIVIQVAIQRKNADKIQVGLEVVIAFCFGYGVDLSMLCLQMFHPANYIVRLLSLLLGCCIIAFGAYLEVVADVVMLPADAFVRAIAKAVKREYGEIRMISDISMSVIAGALCLLFLRQLSGVREGTILSALLVGNLVKVFTKWFKPVANRLVPRAPAVPEAQQTRQQSPHFVITISREYGSGGREIGKALSRRFQIPYYDTELIPLTAEKSGYTEAFVKENEEQMSKLQYKLYSWYTPEVSKAEIPKVERLFQMEEKVIRQVVSQGSCVIVGRLANYILRDYQSSLHVFISADTEAKVRRIVERDGLSPKEAKKKAEKVDQERRTHCRYFAHFPWGQARYYDVALSSSKYGILGASEILAGIVERSLADYPDNSLAQRADQTQRGKHRACLSVFRRGRRKFLCFRLGWRAHSCLPARCCSRVECAQHQLVSSYGWVNLNGLIGPQI